jgi:hypothetical protein
VISKEFFRRLKESVDLSRLRDAPLETDWQEYRSEEERKSFHERLGTLAGSNFLNVGVDTSVTWPREPQRIHFGGHKFVLFPKTKENSHSISIDLAHERISDDDARTLFSRFLSILTWCDDRHAILRDGWSGNSVPVPVPRRYLSSSTAFTWIFSRSMPKDERLLMCLSYYREGLNAAEAGVASQAVLSFFKAFEMQRDGKEVRRWIADNFDEVCSTLQDEYLKCFHEDRREKSIEDYIYENCRVAVAHASKRFQSDSDLALEADRLSVAARVTKALARHCIRVYFGFSESYFSDEEV